MEKNENGTPILNRSGMRAEDMTRRENRAPMNMGNGCPGTNGAPAGNGEGCGGSGDCLDGMPLAYVYAPNQKFRMMYSPEDALSHGTLFEELYKPMEVYGRE